MLTILLIYLIKRNLKIISGKIQKIFSILFIICLLFLPAFALPQSYTYSVLKSDKQIGSLSVKCIKEGQKIKYSISSEAKTGFLSFIRINVMIDEEFENGKMSNSKFIRKVNGIETIKNEVELSKSIYILKDNGDINKTLAMDIKYTMGTMYFIEPENRPFVYSENYQQFVPVTSLGVNKYLINFPDGNKSYYKYSNGICISVEAHTSWSVVFFKLKDFINN